MKLFSILDVKAGHFMQPFAEKSTVNAIRSFEIASNEPEQIFNKFPDDFALMELGSFDLNTGVLTPNAVPANLATSRSLLKVVQ